MTRRWRTVTYIMAAVAALAFASYWEIVTKVRLANHSNAPLMNAQIDLYYGGRILWAGNLAPGESVWVWEMAAGGKVALSYYQDGKKIQHFLGYAGMPVFNGSALVGVYDNGGIDISGIPTLGSAIFALVGAVLDLVETVTKRFGS